MQTLSRPPRCVILTSRRPGGRWRTPSPRRRCRRRSSGHTWGMRDPWVVGVSGASGTPYARAVLIALLDAGESVDLVVSRAARLTLLDETGGTVRDAHWKDDVGAWLGRELGD